MPGFTILLTTFPPSETCVPAEVSDTLCFATLSCCGRMPRSFASVLECSVHFTIFCVLVPACRRVSAARGFRATVFCHISLWQVMAALLLVLQRVHGAFHLISRQVSSIAPAASIHFSTACDEWRQSRAIAHNPPTSLCRPPPPRRSWGRAGCQARGGWSICQAPVCR